MVAPSCVNDLNLSAVGVKTEGFVARDLERIVSRAIHANLMARASMDGKGSFQNVTKYLHIDGWVIVMFHENVRSYLVSGTT